MRSAVSILSLINMGMPCNGPRDEAFGFSFTVQRRSYRLRIRIYLMTELTFGPCLSISWMCSRYFLVSDRSCICRTCSGVLKFRNCRFFQLEPLPRRRCCGFSNTVVDFRHHGFWKRSLRRKRAARFAESLRSHEEASNFFRITPVPHSLFFTTLNRCLSAAFIASST